MYQAEIIGHSRFAHILILISNSSAQLLDLSLSLFINRWKLDKDLHLYPVQEVG